MHFDQSPLSSTIALSSSSSSPSPLVCFTVNILCAIDIVIVLLIYFSINNKGNKLVSIAEITEITINVRCVTMCLRGVRT